jgi:hypothetical protein
MAPYFPDLDVSFFLLDLQVDAHLQPAHIRSPLLSIRIRSLLKYAYDINHISVGRRETNSLLFLICVT